MVDAIALHGAGRTFWAISSNWVRGMGWRSVKWSAIRVMGIGVERVVGGFTELRDIRSVLFCQRRCVLIDDGVYEC